MTERAGRPRTLRMPAPAALVPYRDAREFVLARVSAVAPLHVPVSEALGKPLAERIVAATPVPPHPLAGRRGIAVASHDLVGASPYSPVFLASAPARVMPGDPLPPPADAVIEEQAVTSLHGAHEIGQGAYPGEGAVLPGFDIPQGAEIAGAGATVTPAIALALAMAGTPTVAVRSPLVALDDPQGDGGPEAFWLRTILRDHGCGVVSRGEGHVEILIRRDPRSVEGDAGGSAVGGVALNPGRDTRILWDGERLTFVFAARFDAVVAGFHALIAPALAKLSNRRLRSVDRPLAAKIVSQVGLADLALLRSSPLGYEPLAVGALSLEALIQADAVGIVDPESEGAPAGAAFAATPLKGMYEPS
ncbi:MAG: hypothetical protein DI527_15510 [Chelatococcus sp.]|nr:MAG: hypothetical protein DI527_15510 [Chelatococcus sp.]